MKPLYLSTEEMTKFLDRLNEKDEFKARSVENVEKIILEAYTPEAYTPYDAKDTLRRHSYSDISAYVKETQELVVLFDNLNLLLEHQERVVDQNVINIAYKVRDYLNIEDTRRGQQESARMATHQMKLLERKITEINRKNKENFERIKEISGKNEEIFKRIEDIKDESDISLTMLQDISTKNTENFKKIQDINVKNEDSRTRIQEISDKNQANIVEIQKIQGNIMKEAVAITSVFITVIAFLIANAGIITAIREGGFVHDRARIFETLIQVNATMLIGVSTLMMIAAAFIHKGTFISEDKSNGKDKDQSIFIKSAKFLIPLIVIGFASIVLISSVLVF